ncbi:MAG: hypothetical protein JNK14_15240 [Chitinophagaceae bacterium]|nr:hypothetical protein [Chitinophagaceae bacterium]
MLKATITFLCLVLSIQLFAYYPIDPRPLRMLIKESEYIIRGKVLEVGKEKSSKKDYNSWETDFAIIEIKESIQGHLKDTKIKVHFAGGMICPAPGVFYKNEDVLAFLDKTKKGDGYSVPALSYGVKHGLTEEGFRLYTTRIREMQQILQTKEGKDQEEKILDWLVTCSENKATRWEGIYELSPGNDFMSYYDNNDRRRKDIYLNKQQKQRLFSALLHVDTLDYYDLALVDITKGIDDAIALGILKKGLITVDTTYLFTAEMIMKKIVDFTGDAELDEIHSKFSKLDYFDKNVQTERKTLLSLFIQKMQQVKCREGVNAPGGNYS